MNASDLGRKKWASLLIIQMVSVVGVVHALDAPRSLGRILFLGLWIVSLVIVSIGFVRERLQGSRHGTSSSTFYPWALTGILSLVLGGALLGAWWFLLIGGGFLCAAVGGVMLARRRIHVDEGPRQLAP